MSFRFLLLIEQNLLVSFSAQTLFICRNSNWKSSSLLRKCSSETPKHPSAERSAVMSGWSCRTQGDLFIISGHFMLIFDIVHFSPFHAKEVNMSARGKPFEVLLKICNYGHSFILLYGSVSARVHWTISLAAHRQLFSPLLQFLSTGVSFAREAHVSEV